MKSNYGESGEGKAHQNIARAVMLLNALARSGKKGLRQTDLVQATGLQKSVVHRALAGLLAHGLATQNETRSLYYLGDAIFTWRHWANERFSLANRVRPHLQAVAEDLLDTVHFSIIRNDEALCYCREEGSFPIKMLSLEAGALRPLGVGSGSLVLLTFQPEGFQKRILAMHADARSRFDVDDDTVCRNIQITREKGYALHAGLYAKSMRGVAVPVFNATGVCVGALSAAAIAERLQEPRLGFVVKRLLAEAAAIQEELAELLDEL